MSGELSVQDRSECRDDPDASARLSSDIYHKLLCALSVEDLPIPTDAKVLVTWPDVLIEMAAHIGAYETLVICDAYAGCEVYIPLDPARSPFKGLIKDESIKIMAHVYGRERLPMPTGSSAILTAKRQGVISAIRAGELNIVRGARLLRVARRHLSRLVNQTNEGIGYEPIKLPEPRVLVALRMAASIATEALRSVGAPFDVIESTTTKILDIFFKSVSRRVGEDNDES